MEQCIGDQFPEGDQWVGRDIEHRAVSPGNNRCIEGLLSPFHCSVEHPWYRAGDGHLIADSHPGCVGGGCLGCRLDHEAGQPLLRVRAESQQAGHGGYSVISDRAGALEQLITGKSAEPVPIPQSHVACEVIDQFLIEVRPRGAFDGAPVEMGRLAQTEERLLFDR